MLCVGTFDTNFLAFLLLLFVVAAFFQPPFLLAGKIKSTAIKCLICENCFLAQTSYFKFSYFMA